MNVTGILLVAWVVVCAFTIGTMAKRLTKKYK
jgi:hypothetical protein